ncbi:Lipase A [Fulvia fulva]|uniref:Lipase A n=1 Tax=Passalora fulva TaxID=5499 RepID=A0A9Q8PI05_PASFU|nr:Lipase A [Fulvia fulva]KAK4616056.1 Lipase A [Fulvia fulva]KAK4617227.1 Lipase A [Fulvia fulva]UJO22881.1 Lipase A [Fulvia fulva]WPV19102.1 Lipase A [Fulvia fulva]WPV34153.1 Lipase A [Fulvia fulva]
MLYFLILALGLLGLLGPATSTHHPDDQFPLLRHATGRNVSVALFSELEELARIVDISYCVGLTSFGISKPFRCLSRCTDFPQFELVTTWNTGPLLSDSCGYIALDHGKQRIIVAFRGTYSIANTIVDLSTVPQKYEPYPGEGDGGDATAAVDVSKDILQGIKGPFKRALPTPSEPKCLNCTVHYGFHSSWLNTRKRILVDLQEQIFLYPNYKLNLVGHSLGGAVAALAGLDFLARGWAPTVTTFGEPRLGNINLVNYIDDRFNLTSAAPEQDTEIRYRRVTHVDDPVPLLPLTEWGYAMHAGEIYISKPDLSPDITDVEMCNGDVDPGCIAGQDSTASSQNPNHGIVTPQGLRRDMNTNAHKRDLLQSVKGEIHEARTEPRGIPSRYKLWQLFFAHRDYFWRLGLCVPGGDPLGGGSKYEHAKEDL